MCVCFVSVGRKKKRQQQWAAAGRVCLCAKLTFLTFPGLNEIFRRGNSLQNFSSHQNNSKKFPLNSLKTNWGGCQSLWQRGEMFPRSLHHLPPVSPLQPLCCIAHALRLVVQVYCISWYKSGCVHTVSCRNQSVSNILIIFSAYILHLGWCHAAIYSDVLAQVSSYIINPCAFQAFWRYRCCHLPLYSSFLFIIAHFYMIRIT